MMLLKIVLNGSRNAVLLTYQYQKLFQRLQKLTIFTDIYDIQLHFQNFVRANNNWMTGRIWPAGRSLDTPVLVLPI